MKRQVKRITATCLAVAMATSLIVGQNDAPTSQAAKAKAKKLTVKAAKKTLYVGGKASLGKTKISVTVKPKKASQKVTYKSSNKKVLKVSAKGVVTAKKVGKATVTVTSKSNKKLKKKIKFTVKKVAAKNTNTAVKSTDQPKTTESPAATATPAPTSVPAPTSAPAVELESLSLNQETLSLTKTGKNANPSSVLTAALTPSNATNKMTWSSSDEGVVSVDATGKVVAEGTGTATVTVSSDNGKSASCEVTVQKSTTAIHDPSIFKDPISGKYYTIGTELGMAVSEDLQAWSATTSGVNLLANGIDELDEAFTWTNGDKTIGNVWAGDMIYNKEMKKYCMYVSVNCGGGYGYRTAIAMLSSDQVTGPYKYEGLIVCADFTKGDIAQTNIMSALGITSEDEIPSYYYDASETTGTDSAYYKNNFPDCIDAAPFYGEDGNLYMVYGSFTCYGGIHLLKLDPKTGLRSAAYNYEKTDDSDPYFGKKLTNKAGEGPYIQQVKSSKSSTGSYYYLWTSSGLLRGTGTYHMTMFRSENVDGPYVDMNGTAATSGGGILSAYNYKFSFMDMAYTAMGGNSALVDDDGKIFLVYHNKFEDNSPNPGTHMLKIHQMYENEDGWLVTSPYEYHGETIKDSYTKDEVVGNYEFVIHRMNTAQNYGNYNYNKSVAVKLNADGSISGNINGTWTLKGNQIEIKEGSTTYKGVVVEQYEDDGNTGNVTSKDKTLVITALGDNQINIWGSKITATDKEAVTYDMAQVSIPDTLTEDYVLPTSGMYGSEITWTSNSDAITIEDGKAVVHADLTDATVALIATAKSGTKTKAKKFTVVVPGLELNISTVVRSNHIDLPTKLGSYDVTWTSSNTDVIDTDGTVTLPASGASSVVLTATINGITKEYTVMVLPETITNYIYKQDYTEVTTASTVMTSTNSQDTVTIESDTEHGNYLQFASPTGNSRGAYSDFGVSDTATGVYCVEFDMNLTAGTGQESQFALTGSDMKYTNSVINDGIDSGYLFKMSALNSTVWTLNNGDTVDLGNAWTHVLAVVDAANGKATLEFTQNGENIYTGVSTISGTGALKGFYVRNGRYNSKVQFDNVYVY